MAASQHEQKKVRVVISSPTPQRGPLMARRIAPTTTATPLRRRRATKVERERAANSPTRRIKQIRQRRQMMEETPMPRASRDFSKIVPDDWWMSFNTLDEHFAWSIVRRQVQTQLLKFEFLVCPVAFGMAAPRMTDLLTVFTRPLVRLERREHNRIVRQRFMRHVHHLLTGKTGNAALDTSDAVNEYDDPSPHLMLLGPADRIGALSAMGRRKTRNVTTTPLQAMYRAMLSQSHMGLTKSIDMTFFGIRWSSVPVFGPREYQLRVRLIAALRKSRDPLHARPPTNLFIVHDVVWAERAKIRLTIGDDVYERWTGRVNLGYKLAMYDRFSPAGMVAFPTDYADPMLYFDKMLSPRHTMWVEPPAGFDEEEGELKRTSKHGEPKNGSETSAPSRFSRRHRTKYSIQTKAKLKKITPNASMSALYGSLLEVPSRVHSRSLTRSRSRSEEKRDNDSIHLRLPRSRSASALLTHADDPAKEPTDHISPETASLGSSEETPAHSFVRGPRSNKTRMFKSKLLQARSRSTSTATGLLPMKRLGRRMNGGARRSRSASAVLMSTAVSAVSAALGDSSYAQREFLSDRSYSTDASYTELLFEPTRVASAFDSILEGRDFFSSAENMRGPVRNLPPF
uniref:Uncharacterized protein n=1 Tax=Plectus sambesii TaxID=2011161 RepID=A0A914VGB5_9BILA